MTHSRITFILAYHTRGKVVPGGNRHNDTHVGTYVCTRVGMYVQM